MNTTTGCTEGVGLPCPDCHERGMVRVGDLLYRCRHKDDGPVHHMRDMMPELMGHQPYTITLSSSR